MAREVELSNLCRFGDRNYSALGLASPWRIGLNNGTKRSWKSRSQSPVNDEPVSESLVRVAKALELKAFFDTSVEYVSSLKPKATSKKKTK
jgi:hypothetical protein